MSRYFLASAAIEGFRGINNDGDPLVLKFKHDAVNCERDERPTYRGGRRMKILRPNFERRMAGWTRTALMPCIKTCMKPVIIGGSS